MSPFGVEHEPLTKAWAGALPQSKKAETLLRTGRLKQRVRAPQGEAPRSKHFGRQVLSDVSDRVSSRQLVGPHDGVDAYARLAQTVRPYAKQRQGRVRNSDINGVDLRSKPRDSRRLRFEDPDFHRSA